MTGRVEGKVALVTGAARGQGRSHALRLAAEGADVIAIDICRDIASNHYPLSRPEDLEETVRQVEAFDRRAVAYQADVRDRSALTDAVNEGVSLLGRLDIVVANAGIAPLGADVPPGGFLDAVQVDFGGVVNTIEAALPHLSGGASIIATGSVAALMAGGTDSPTAGPGGSGYSWAKRAVATFVHSLALQLAPSNIRVNAVHPTNVDTDMLQSEPMYKVFRPDLVDPTRADAQLAFRSMQPMPVPYVDVADISSAILYLASDDARYVTGMQLKIDAGAMLTQAYPAMGA